jgi:hypothetical protein
VSRYWMRLFGLTWLLVHGGLLTAAIIEVTGFTQITSARFYEVPASNALTPVTMGGVVITPQVSLLNESFAGANAPQFGPDVPGNGAGFGSDSTGFGGATPLMLDFSQPVAAFGATFVHSQNIANDASFTFPVSIQLFSGLNGTGGLLGTVTDSAGGVKYQGPAFADFRGLWSDSPLIRSAEISATSSQSGGFEVDGYAISVMPMPTPEPLTLVLVGGGLIGLGIVWRYSRK